ncbi:hypothetical protein CYU10_000081 [Lactococcus lactis subsp. lactis]|uniref:Uncharacterized protein n=1 Tax=Lactococcus lactis subsp. lactis TaxID=1360 RepID=A0A2R7Y019_LACLL|nr:hypothetical protein CYU10_000081 [Lactococcus lactis subsp. lactis]
MTVPITPSQPVSAPFVAGNLPLEKYLPPIFSPLLPIALPEVKAGIIKSVGSLIFPAASIAVTLIRTLGRLNLEG